MSRNPIAVEREPEYNIAYLRYREDVPGDTGQTVGYADHQVNVDVDETGAIVGIEILSLGAEELAALAEIATAYELDLSPLIGGTVPSAT